MRPDKRDLTTIEAVQQAHLADLERYLREFLTFLPLPICIVNPLGIITDVNRAFSQLFGYEEMEIIGKEAIILFKDKKQWQDLERRILKKKVIKGREVILIKKDGKEIPIALSASFRENEEGVLIGYFLALTDITTFKELQGKLEQKVKERTKELEEAKATLEIRVKARTKQIRELAEGLEQKVKERTKGLVESRDALLNILEDVEEERRKVEEEKNKTLAIINNFADGLLVFDKEDRLALINPRADDYFALKTKNITGKTISELSKIPAFKELITLYKKEPKEIFREELKIRDNLVLEITTVPLMIEKEKLGTLIILHDVTREKLVERMKTEFVSLAAHQLRTPLSAIKWTMRMVLDKELGKLNKEQEEFLEDAYRSNERMIALINDLLNVTRIEEGRYIYNLTPVNIEKLIKAVINAHRDQMKRNRIKVEFKKPAKRLPKLMVDDEKIQIAIDNIFDNAIRYSLPGGKVTVSLRYDKKEIELSVKDNGLGIPKTQQRRVFTKFFRGANVIKKETEGSGLGLFITKNIIEAHGGKIWFESKMGKGTTFYFRLPIK